MPGAWWSCCCGGGGTPGDGVTVCPEPITDDTTNFLTAGVTLEWRALTRYEYQTNETCILYCDGAPASGWSLDLIDHGLSGLVGCEIIAWEGLALFDACECFAPMVVRHAIAPKSGGAAFEIWCQAGTPPGGAGWYVCNVMDSSGATTATGWARNTSDSAPAGWTIRLLTYGRCIPNPCGGRYLHSGYLVELAGGNEYAFNISEPAAGCADTNVDDYRTVNGNVSVWYTRPLTAGDTVGCMPAGTYVARHRCESLCAPIRANCPASGASGCCGADAGGETICECL
jgi:hypothetical protein